MAFRASEEEVRDKIKHLGEIMGFEVEEEWTPSTLRERSRRGFYIPRIDIIWFKRCDSKFIRFLELFKDQGVLDPYRDVEKEIVIGFELELTDRPTKYILGDISNLSRLCNYGFIVMRNVENLVERSIKASRAFSILHGSSNVFIINPEDLDKIINYILETDKKQSSKNPTCRAAYEGML
jgi:hypothetical protein